MVLQLVFAVTEGKQERMPHLEGALVMSGDVTSNCSVHIIVH